MAGQKLLKRADFHLGQKITRLTRISKESGAFNIYSSSHGSVGCLTSLSEKSYRRLNMLYQKMVHLLPQNGGLNPKAFRQQSSEEHRKLGTNARSILDHNFLMQFTFHSKVHQRELSKAIGSSLEKIYEDLMEIEKATAFK